MSLFSSVAQLCLTLCDPMNCSTPGFPVHHQLLELSQTHVHRVGDAIQPSHPLSSLSPPAFNPSSNRVFPSESVLCIKWPKYWSFSISPSNEYSGLISFRVDWFDLLAVQGTLKNLLQHHNSKASVLQRSAFFMAPLWHPYITTGITTALTSWTFVDKVTSLLFSMWSRHPTKDGQRPREYMLAHGHLRKKLQNQDQKMSALDNPANNPYTSLSIFQGFSTAKWLTFRLG